MMKLCLRFYYVNHRGEGHDYVLWPAVVKLAEDDHEYHAGHLILRGIVYEKDGAPKQEVREFQITKMQSVTEVERKVLV